MANNYEDQLTFAVAQYLDLQGWLWTHFPAGEKRHPKTGAKLKRMGLKRGVPDMLIFEPVPEHRVDAYLFGPFVGVAIELKSPGRYPTKEQREWLAGLKERGWSVHVCRTLDEVIDACEIIGGTKCQ